MWKNDFCRFSAKEADIDTKTTCFGASGDGLHKQRISRSVAKDFGPLR